MPDLNDDETYIFRLYATKPNDEHLYSPYVAFLNEDDLSKMSDMYKTTLGEPHKEGVPQSGDSSWYFTQSDNDRLDYDYENNKKHVGISAMEILKDYFDIDPADIKVSDKQLKNIYSDMSNIARKHFKHKRQLAINNVCRRGL